MTQSRMALVRPPRKLVIVQPGFVGDVVFISPLVYELKHAFPESFLTLMVRPERADVARCIPGVDDVIEFDKRGVDSGPTGLYRASRKLKKGGFDVLIAPHRSSRTALLAKLSGIPKCIGYRSGIGRMCFDNPVAIKENEPCRLLQDFQLLDSIGVTGRNCRLRLNAPQDQATYLSAFYRSSKIPEDAKLVALCIGSVWPTKRWPAIYFASLAEALREKGYHPVLFGGPDEVPIALEVENAVTEQRLGSTKNGKNGDSRRALLSCVGNSLAESAALLQHCEMAVGSDSGLTHMARALGVPTVVIYGPTDHRLHSFGERTRVLFARVKCRPCHRHGQNQCPERHHDCMRLVSPEQVLEALKEISPMRTPLVTGAEVVARSKKSNTNLPVLG